MKLITDLRVKRINLTTECDNIRALMSHEDLALVQANANPGECKANLMLAVRHVEDATMRLGKAIQAMDGGVSCYNDRAKVAEETSPQRNPASVPAPAVDNANVAPGCAQFSAAPAAAQSSETAPASA